MLAINILYFRNHLTKNRIKTKFTQRHHYNSYSRSQIIILSYPNHPQPPIIISKRAQYHKSGCIGLAFTIFNFLRDLIKPLFTQTYYHKTVLVYPFFSTPKKLRTSTPTSFNSFTNSIIKYLKDIQPHTIPYKLYNPF